MRPCGWCGTPNPDNGVLCKSCGHWFTANTAPPQEPIVRTSFGHAVRPANARDLADYMRRLEGAHLALPPQESDPGPSQAHPDRTDGGDLEAATREIVANWVDVLVEDPRRMTAAEAFESVFAFQNERYVKNLNFTVTASMFVWRSVFDAVGGFENGVPEDLDWCRRARLKGVRSRQAHSRRRLQWPIALFTSSVSKAW